MFSELFKCTGRDFILVLPHSPGRDPAGSTPACIPRAVSGVLVVQSWAGLSVSSFGGPGAALGSV